VGHHSHTDPDCARRLVRGSIGSALEDGALRITGNSICLRMGRLD
jgi:hypothetical protein